MSVTPDTTPAHLPDVLAGAARRDPSRVLLLRRGGPAGEGWHEVPAKQFLDEVTALARGFVGLGLEPGDRVAIMAKTRYEWTLVDFAVWFAGGVPVPVYETSSADQLASIVADSQASLVVVETDGHARRLASVRDRLPDVRGAYALDADAGGLPGLDAVLDAGREVAQAEVEARVAALGPDSLATLIYTSGTTGRPKGCMLTHGNFIAECASAIEMLPELFARPDASTLMFLPLAHVFGRMVQVAVVLAPACTLALTDVGRLTKDLQAVRPTFVLAVPQVLGRVYETARRRAEGDGRERVFTAAADTAVAISRARDRGRRPSPLLLAKGAVFERLVYRRLRGALGGRCEHVVSGGAPLGEHLAHFFRGIGVPVLEGYGLTENTAAAAVNTTRATRIGTVGRALPRFEVSLGGDGEVLVRGGHVFAGYWRDDEATAAALDGGGWLHTGDLGRLDDGFLSITGRKKDIIVTAGGKNVAPAPLENALTTAPLVGQALLVGDQRAEVGALITLDEEALGPWLAGRGRAAVPASELTRDPEVLAELQKAVDAANATVSSAEGIKRLRVLPHPFTEDAGHVTPTLKLRRSAIVADFADEIDAMYGHRR